MNKEDNIYHRIKSEINDKFFIKQMIKIISMNIESSNNIININKKNKIQFFI